MSGCMHQDGPDCLWCDATRATHPQTRCPATHWIDGALLVRCERPYGHPDRCHVGDREFTGIKERGRYELDTRP